MVGSTTQIMNESLKYQDRDGLDCGSLTRTDSSPPVLSTRVGLALGTTGIVFAGAESADGIGFFAIGILSPEKRMGVTCPSRLTGSSKAFPSM
jgi:hypothetical protein